MEDRSAKISINTEKKEIEKEETEDLISNIFEWLEKKSLLKVDSFSISYKDEFLNVRIKYISGIEEILSFCITPDKKYFYPINNSTIERN